LFVSNECTKHISHSTHLVSHANVDDTKVQELLNIFIVKTDNIVDNTS
jgi:hypothetical protein